MDRRTLTTLASLTTTAALVLTGCGGDSDDAPEESRKASASPEVGGSDAASASPSAEASLDPADVAIAEASLLGLPDFPAGWQAVPQDPEDDEDVASKKRIAQCVGVDHGEFYGDRPSAESPEFTNEDDETISFKVVLQTEEKATEDFAVVASSTYRDCIAEEVTGALEESIEGEGGTVGEITLNEVSVGQHGDDVTAFRVEVPFEADGFSAKAELDFTVVRVGRALIQVTGYRISVGSLTTEDYVRYVDLATERATTALGAA